MSSRVYVHAYRVSGNGPFPIDMLRKDGSYPATEEGANAITSSLLGAHRADALPRVVMLIKVAVGSGFEGAHWRPNRQRWESFGWTIVERSYTTPDGAVHTIRDPEGL